MSVDIASRLHEWATEEMGFLPQKSNDPTMPIPTKDQLAKICRGKNQAIWIYVLDHVRSKSTVVKVKRNLSLNQYYRNVKRPEAEVLASEKDNLMQKISSLEAKKCHLENMITDLQVGVYSLDDKLRNLKRKICETREMFTFLEMHGHLQQTKYSTLRLFASDLIKKHEKIKISHFKETNSFITKDDVPNETETRKYPVDRTFEYSISNKNLLSVSHKTIEDTVTSIKQLFYALSDAKCAEPSILHFNKKKAWNDVEKLMAATLPSQLISYLEIQAEKIVQSIEDVQNISEENQASCNVEKYGTSFSVAAELENQKLYHISKFLEKNKLVNDVARILNEQESTLHHVSNWLQLSGKTKDELELIKMLLCIEAEIKGTSSSINTLKQLISDMKNKTQILQKRNSTSLAECQELQDLQIKVSRNQTLICELMKQNMQAIQKCREEQQMLQNFVCGIMQPDKSVIENSASQLKMQITAEKDIFQTAVKRIKFLQPSIIKYDLWKSYFGDKHLTSLGILPFQNSDIAAQKCMIMKRNADRTKQLMSARCLLLSKIKRQQNIYNNEALWMEKKIELNKLLEKVYFVAVSGNESAESGEKLCDKIYVAMNDWWEQPAQFIPDIVVENRSLKEWLKLISIQNHFDFVAD